GPERTDVAREFIRGSWVKDPEGFEILQCKQVKRPVLDRVRADYPGFEIVDCTFRHKDGLGNPLTETHNLWILDGKVINSEGMTCNESGGRDAEPDLETYLRYVIIRTKDPEEANRMKEKLREAAGEPPRRGMGGR